MILLSGERRASASHETTAGDPRTVFSIESERATGAESGGAGADERRHLGPDARPPAQGRASQCARDIWLILPVVICLSQRLSHAGVSTN